MTINRTTLLDLPLPVTGTESGTWGDIVNNGLSEYIDISVAGSLSLSADSDTDLSSTEGNAVGTNIGSTTAQYAILRCTGGGSIGVTKQVSLSGVSATGNVGSFGVLYWGLINNYEDAQWGEVGNYQEAGWGLITTQ